MSLLLAFIWTFFSSIFWAPKEMFTKLRSAVEFPEGRPGWRLWEQVCVGGQCGVTLLFGWTNKGADLEGPHLPCSPVLIEQWWMVPRAG